MFLVEFSGFRYFSNMTQGVLLFGGVATRNILLGKLKERLEVDTVNVIKIRSLADFRQNRDALQLESVYGGKWFVEVDVKALSEKDLGNLMNMINQPNAFYYFYVEDFKDYNRISKMVEFKGLPYMLVWDVSRLEDVDMKWFVSEIVSKEFKGNKKKINTFLKSNFGKFMVTEYRYVPEKLFSFLEGVVRGEFAVPFKNLNRKMMIEEIGLGSISPTYLLMRLLLVDLGRVSVPKSSKKYGIYTEVNRAFMYHERVMKRALKIEKEIFDIFFSLQYIYNTRGIVTMLVKGLDDLIELKQMQYVGDITAYNLNDLDDTDFKRYKAWFRAITTRVTLDDILELRLLLKDRDNYSYYETEWFLLVVSRYIKSKIIRGVEHDKNNEDIWSSVKDKNRSNGERGVISV